MTENPSDHDSQDAEAIARALSAMSLHDAAERALFTIRTVLCRLNAGKRTARRDAIILLPHAIRCLDAGLRNDLAAGERGVSEEMKRALGPRVTCAEIEGMRTVLELMLDALPPTPDLGGTA